MKSVPRDVKTNASGGMMLIVAAALVGAGMWGGIELTRSAERSQRQVSQFASERVVTAGDVIQLRKRGGGNDHRIVAHYRYAVQGRELNGTTTLRRDEREKYLVGSPIAVWYLPAEPEASWLDGYAPRAEASWPATVIPLVCGVSAMALIVAVRRQLNLLTNGRAAPATVTKVEKKKGDHGTYWVVYYEWTIMSGATRTGKYHHSRKDVPAVGGTLPIVYDRDNTFRHRRYPMSLVRVADAQ